MKDAPADGFLNEFREVAFFHALGAQKGTQGMIGFLGPGNGQTGGFFWLGLFILNHISIYPLISLSCYEVFVKQWGSNALPELAFAFWLARCTRSNCLCGPDHCGTTLTGGVLPCRSQPKGK